MALRSWTALLTRTPTIACLFSRDFFDRQKKLCVGHNDAERYRKQANTDQEELNYPEIVHEALSESELDETCLLNLYGLAAQMHAHIVSMMKELEAPGCGSLCCTTSSTRPR